MSWELVTLNYIIEQKDKIISQKDYEVGEYKLAIRIPRLHYKHLENLRFEEIMKQRDEIIQKMQRKYGVDPTKAISMMKSPDPTLPLEEQLEILHGGKIQKPTSKSPSVDKPVDPLKTLSATLRV